MHVRLAILSVCSEGDSPLREMNCKSAVVLGVLVVRRGKRK